MQTICGTWQLSPSDGFWNEANALESEKIITKAVHLGLKRFDCAQGYGNGLSEQILGKVLSRYSSTSFLVDTKIMPSSKDVASLLETSLRRLKTDHVNTLYIHWPSSKLPWQKMLCDMEKLKEQGKISKIGICNLTLPELKNLCREVKPDVFQRPLSLIWSREWKETLSFCKEKNIECVTYSPLGMGTLVKNGISDRRKDLFCYKEPCSDAFNAIKNQLSGPEEALLWVKAQEPDCLILGSSCADQLEANVKSLEKELSRERNRILTDLADALSCKSEAICDNIFSYRY